MPVPPPPPPLELELNIPPIQVAQRPQLPPIRIIKEDNRLTIAFLLMLMFWMWCGLGAVIWRTL